MGWAERLGCVRLAFASSCGCPGPHCQSSADPPLSLRMESLRMKGLDTCTRGPSEQRAPQAISRTSWQFYARSQTVLVLCHWQSKAIPAADAPCSMLCPASTLWPCSTQEAQQNAHHWSGHPASLLVSLLLPYSGFATCPERHRVVS